MSGATSQERLQAYLRLHPNKRRSELVGAIKRLRAVKNSLEAQASFRHMPGFVKELWRRAKGLHLLGPWEQEYSAMISAIRGSDGFKTYCAAAAGQRRPHAARRPVAPPAVAASSQWSKLAQPLAVATVAGQPRTRVWKDDSVPDRELMTPLPIQSLQQLDAPFEETIYLLLDKQRATELKDTLVAAGAYITRHGLAAVKRDSTIDFTVLDRYLPIAARQAPVPIIGDLIPTSSFGSSLNHLLTPGAWDELREEAFASTGARCEVCGSGKDMECHELWEYFEPATDDGGPGVQRLQRLLPLCKACHATHHLGWQAEQDRREGRDFWYPRAIERLAGINRWRVEDASDYDANFLCPRCARRSAFDWALDVSVIAREGRVLKVGEKWDYSEEHENLILDGPNFVSITRILGAKWRFARGPLKGREFFLDPKEHYEGFVS